MATFQNPFAVPWECSRCQANGIVDPVLTALPWDRISIGWLWSEIGDQHRAASPECALRGLLYVHLSSVLVPSR